VFKKILEQIREEEEKFGDELQPPCSKESILLLNKEVNSKLDYSIPVQYNEFLLITNGLDYNGLVIYASERSTLIGYEDRIIEGFIDANLVFRESELFENIIVFGESDNVLYIFDKTKNKYRVVDKISLDTVDTIKSFDILIVQALEMHLQ